MRHLVNRFGYAAALGSVAFACLTVGAGAAFADTTGLERTYLERAAIAAADESCDLFSEGERLALKSGLYQTEGELLRAGRSPQEIRELTSDVATHAKSLGCEHPSVMEVAATVRDSYRKFVRETWMEYPTQRSSWGASRSGHDAWAVMQPDKASGAMFGLRRDPKTKDLKLALALPVKGRPASSARMLLRDPARMPDPWLGSLLGAASGVTPAPRALSKAEWASEFKREFDAIGDPIHVFYFGAAALERLQQLDPREALVIELTPSPLAKDAKPPTYVFEVGDIRAAYAFVAMPAPTYEAAGGTKSGGAASGQH